MRQLCRLDDIPDGEARGFPASPGGFVGLFAVRQGADVRVYVNACPHLGVALDRPIERFLSADRTRIICGAHGAEFRIADGDCVRGPCLGDRLEPVPVRIVDGAVLVPEAAGL